jgi:hypothetical protein
LARLAEGKSLEDVRAAIETEVGSAITTEQVATRAVEFIVAAKREVESVRGLIAMCKGEGGSDGGRARRAGSDTEQTKSATQSTVATRTVRAPDACAGLACGDVCGGTRKNNGWDSHWGDDDGIAFYCQGTVPVFYVGILRCCKISHACWLEVSRCVIGCYITVCLSGISFFTMSFTALQH